MFKSLVKSIVSERFLWATRYYLHPKKFDVVGGPLTFKKDGLATAHNSDTLEDPLFVEAYNLAKKTGSFKGTWGEVDPEYRCYMVCWAAFYCRNLPGDYVECGVNKGGMSRAAMHYMGFTPETKRKFYLFDTYEGTPQHCLRPDETNRNIYDECYEEVQKNFKDFSNVVIVKGEVPQSLSQVNIEKIAYLSLDMNAIGPEMAATEFFWPKLSPGGLIVLDDYNNIGHEPQKRGFDEFCASKGIKVMSLPTGQGLIFKPF